MKLLQALLALFACAFLPLHAASLKDLTWATTNGEVTITDCKWNASGELVIPDTIEGNPVTSIGDSAFYNCRSLTSITIGNGVTSIGERAFFRCTGLTTIEVGAENVNYADVNGVLFNKEKTVLHTYPAGKTGDNYVIANSVTSIGDYAFFLCTGLTSITIPDGVTSIGRVAFNGCSSLTSITIGNGVTSIGDEAFGNCTSLTSITIGNGVTSIGADAFYECTSLTSITIPNGVTSIGEGAFGGCTSLTTIEVSTGNANYMNVEGVLFNKGKTTLHTYPAGKTGDNYVIANSVTSIGVAAFYECTSLTSITIPDSVTSIGGAAFYDCTSLTSITIPDGVTSIGDYAFNACTSLTNITIPDGVTSIGNQAFGGCSSLTALTFLGDAPEIENEAFKDSSPTIYREADAKGWGDTLAGRPVKLITEKP